MRVSIRKTVVAAVAALGMATAVATISTPAEAQWHGGGGGFHGGGFHGGGFGGGFHGGGWGGGGWQAAAGAGPDGEAAAGAGVAPAGAADGAAVGVVVGAAAAGIAAGVGAAVGAGAMIRAGRSPRRPCPSGSRSRRSRPMRRTRLLGQAARLDGEWPLSGPAAREHLRLSLTGRSDWASDKRV